MNKFLILIAAFLFSIQFSNAQTSAGSQTVGFNLGFGSAKSTETPGPQQAGIGSAFIERNHSFNFGPAYSYFIANDLDIGAAIDLMSVTETNEPNNFGYPLKYYNHQASGTVYARKYFLFKNKFGIRTGPFISYGKSTYNYTYDPAQNYNANNSTSRNLDVGLKVEMVYYTSKKLGFAATLANLQYSHATSQGWYQLNQSSDQFSFYSGTSAIYISMFYTFGGKG